MTTVREQIPAIQITEKEKESRATPNGTLARLVFKTTKPPYLNSDNFLIRNIGHHSINEVPCFLNKTIMTPLFLYTLHKH